MAEATLRLLTEERKRGRLQKSDHLSSGCRIKRHQKDSASPSRRGREIVADFWREKACFIGDRKQFSFQWSRFR